MNDGKVMFLRQISLLLRSGIPLLRVLNILNDQQKGFAGIKIAKIIHKIEAGGSFSEALAEGGNFREFISSIRIAENSGTLEESLARAADLAESKMNFKKGLIKSMAYPAVVLSLSFVCLIFLLVFILPMFTRMFSDNSIPIPLITRIVISVSDQWLIIIGGIFLLVPVVFCLWRNIDLRFKIPYLGGVFRRLHLAEACHNIGSQLEAGVPAIESIRSARDGAASKKISNSIAEILSGVGSGRSFSRTLHDSGIFPPFVVQMAMVGEESGALGKMLVTAGNMLEAQAEESLRKITLLIEPAATLTVGLIVGFIAFSVMMPLFSMMGSML